MPLPEVPGRPVLRRWTGVSAAATVDVHEETFGSVALARVLGAQYVAGGVLALLWTTGPSQSEAPGHVAVLSLGVLAIGLGGLMGLLSLARPRRPVMLAVIHACVLSAQVVVAAGHAATGTPISPLLLFMVWTTPFAGVFSARARWAHTTTTLVCLATAVVVVVSRGGDPHATWMGMVITMATVLVVMLLVVRVTGALRTQVMTDALTGLHNRRAFSLLASGALAADGGRSRVAVVVLDLDRFKNVNDTYGHHTGDALLVRLAPRLVACAPAGAVVARLGGDEFAVLAAVPDERGAVAVADGLSRAWRDPLPLEHGVLHVTGSLGVALSAPGATPETLLRDADVAMYRAKELGSGGAQLFRPDMRSASARLLALESELRSALSAGQLQLAYQPVVALQAAQPYAVGAEALLRWSSPVLGVVDPGEFVPVAESTGLIGPLGTWVMETALDDLVDWRRRGIVGDDFRVAVNVSAHQVDDGLPDLVERLLRERQLPPRCLGVEVTESAVVRGEVAERVLARLSALGVVLLLDDFGTGQSSLAQLHLFPFDVVKVDRSFVARMTIDRADRSIVQAVVSLAEALELSVVAEGVETADHERALQDLRCHAGQGWLYSRAVPAVDLPLVLARLRPGRDGPCQPAVPAQRRSVRPLTGTAGS